MQAPELFRRAEQAIDNNSVAEAYGMIAAAVGFRNGVKAFNHLHELTRLAGESSESLIALREEWRQKTKNYAKAHAPEYLDRMKGLM